MFNEEVKKEILGRINVVVFTLKLKGFNKLQIAEKMGFSYGTYQNLLNGELPKNFDTLNGVLDYCKIKLSISVDYKELDIDFDGRKYAIVDLDGEVALITNEEPESYIGAASKSKVIRSGIRKFNGNLYSICVNKDFGV